MHWAWQVAKAGADPAKVPAEAGVDIEWDHGEAAASTQGAMAMVSGDGLAYKPSLTSRHIQGRAIDMTITGIDRLVPRPAGGPFVGAGVFGAGARTLRQRSANELRMRVDGVPQAVLACASREGFHVVRTKGTTTLGHLYLSFG